MEKITLSYETKDGVTICITLDGFGRAIPELNEHWASFLRAMGYPLNAADTIEWVKAEVIPDPYPSEYKD